MSKSKVPRNILLLEEYENSMKGMYGNLSFGLVNEDITLTNWFGSIIDKNYDVIEFNFTCEKEYPNLPPCVSFDLNNISPIHKQIKNMCNSDGTLKKEIVIKLGWNSNMKINEYLTNLRNILDKEN